jgi:hypothetical protein
MGPIQVVDQIDLWPKSVRAEYMADMLAALQKVASESKEFGFLKYLLGLSEQEARRLAARSS